MRKPSIIRLDPGGPSMDAWTKLDLDPKDFQSDLPEQYWHIYFQDEQLGLTVGVWTTTSMQEAFGPYPGDEFMIISEGHVAFVDGEGRKTFVQQGETFVVSNGLPISWKQDGFCRKIFMTYQPPSMPSENLKYADRKISVLTTKALEPFLKSTNPRSQNRGKVDTSAPQETICCTNETGNMVAGLMQNAMFQTEMAHTKKHEIVQLLTGSVQITEAGGYTHEFNAQEVFFLPAGTQCAWHSAAPTSHYFCRFNPTSSTTTATQ